MHQLQPQNPPMRIPVLFSWLFLMPICLLSISFCISAVSGQCLANQQSLLLQLKNSLVFDTALATKLVHWNQTVVDCCSWEGVTCDIKGRVIGLDLTNESISGELGNSRSLFSLRYLQHLNLAYNNFSNEIPSQFDKLTNLSYLNLSNACFTGQNIPVAISHLTRFYRKFPEKIFQIPTLQTIDLSSNIYLSYCNFNGSIPKSMAILTQLLYLDMSGNNFVGSIPSFNMGKSLTTIDLSNNDLTGPITSTRWEKLPNLEFLDLRYNSLEGSIPISLFSLPSLLELKLSNNRFSGRLNELPTVSSYLLKTLDLSRNNLEGPIPMSVFPEYAEYLDFSKNNFSSVIPAGIGDSLTHAYYFSLSSNKFYGSIPGSMCNATKLRVLDLSNNFLSGTVPQCLFEMSEAQESLNRGLGVLNLRRNNLTGTIFDVFPSNCGLQTLSLNGNQLEGKLPRSLARCTSLEVLNLGNNHIEDVFPCYLKNISMLQILILRSNKFYGPVDCRGLNASWPKLQIIDLAANNFTGKLPIKYFSDWKAITDDKNEAKYLLHHLHFGGQPDKKSFFLGDQYDISSRTCHCNIPMNTYDRDSSRGACVRDSLKGTCDRDSLKGTTENVIDINYQDVITVTSKGQEAELVKILNIFNSLDFSCNNFDGPIPREIGELTGLYILNLSYNAFRGPIPQSLGKLTNLESLDLSSNKLTGEIPIQLADGLIFLSVLNLSFNQLVGKIPQIKQFATFPETSYEGNIGLCGSPLNEKCTREEPGSSPPTFEETYLNFGNAIDWNFLSVELGFVFGFGIVIWPLMIWKRWRICYYKHVDDIFFKMFPQLYIRIENRQRQAHMNQGPRAQRNQGHMH